MSSPTLELTQALIRRSSVTPEDAGCQELLGQRLAAAGFTLTPMRFGEVDNLWARRGAGPPLLVLAGHTDVVPPGDPAAWDGDPFQPRLHEGFLYGRGAADMKASLAAFVTAIERFVAGHPDHGGSLGVLLTSDEEGPAVDGTVRVIEQLCKDGVEIDYCLVGEPSSLETLGDTMRNGRRGSLTGILTVLGVQGHVAYPESVRNPIHEAAHVLAELSRTRWDEGNAHYPPTSFQVSNIAAGTGADNVVPGRLSARFNFRYCTETTAERLMQQVESVLGRHGLDYRLEWQHSGAPFITESGRLLDVVAEATRAVLGTAATASTGGGTSDGRFIRPAGAEVVELGPVNATIHKVNERIAVDDVDRLSAVYEAIIERLLR